MNMVAVLHEDCKSQPRYPAHALGPEDRQQIGVDALTKHYKITAIANEHAVSRKFVRQQRDRAQQALDAAFQPPRASPSVLYWIPVTRAWLEQVVLVLLFCCRSSYRGVQQFFRCLLDDSISLGKIHNLVSDTANKGREINARESVLFENIEAVAMDEIFQQRRPVLAGLDLRSGYCFALEDADSRDADTWEACLQSCCDEGLQPEQAITDAGRGLCAGLREVWPDVLHGDDHFHRLRDFGRLVQRLERRAYKAMSTLEALEKKMKKARRKGEGNRYSRALGYAREGVDTAVDLAEDMAILYRWLRREVLAKHGPSSTERAEMLRFIVDEMRQRESKYRGIKTLRKTLENHQDELLMFARRMDVKLHEAGEKHGLNWSETRALFDLMSPPDHGATGALAEVVLRRQLGEERYDSIREAFARIERGCVRASSLVENLNSQLRRYFSLRRRAGQDFCDLLRFYLNHRRLMRSRRSERCGKSPAEVLSGEKQEHWLEQLGYTLFRPLR